MWNPCDSVTKKMCDKIPLISVWDMVPITHSTSAVMLCVE